MNIEIIRFLQNIRNDILDWFFYLITQIGDQIIFIFIAVVIFWVYDKRFAFKITISFLLGSIINLAVKMTVKIDRPYTKPGITEPNMPVLKPVLPGVHTEGYSFPSGHSQNAAVLGYSMIDEAKKKGKKTVMIFSIIIMILVPISRMYLAQHYITDVIAGLVLGIIITCLIFKMIDKTNDKEHLYALFFIPIFLGLMVFLRNSLVPLAAGGYIGFVIGYYFEKTAINFKLKQPLGQQILKVLIGFVGIVGIYLLFKVVLPSGRWNDFFNYFSISLWATLGAPAVFKYGLKH
ncbi:MAG: phosphatase PAP2 family protein [Acholeplasmataceae bacterium]